MNLMETLLKVWALSFICQAYSYNQPEFIDLTFTASFIQNNFNSCVIHITKVFRNDDHLLFHYDKVIESISHIVSIQSTKYPEYSHNAPNTLENTTTFCSLQRKSFSYHRFTSLCTIRLVSDLYEDNKRVYSDLSSFIFQNHNHGTADFTLIPEDFIVVTGYLDQNEYKVRYITLPEDYLATKIIMINLKSNGILITCFSCSKEYHLYEIIDFEADTYWFHRTHLFIHLSSISKSLTQLQLEWTSLNKNLDNIGHTAKIYDYDKYICSGRKDIVILGEYHCLLQLLHFKRNCTFLECRFLLESYIYLGSARDIEIEVGEVPVTYGSLPGGIRFFVVFSLNEGRGKINGTYLSKLLSPLPFSIWLASVILFTLKAAVLNLNSRSENERKGFVGWALWLAIVILGDNGGRVVHWKKNLKIGYLTVLWIYFGILLRNLYNSTMYSHLTKSPEITNLPKSIEDLFIKPETAIPVISTYNTIRKMFSKGKIGIHHHDDKLSDLISRHSKITNINPFNKDFIQNISNGQDFTCKNFHLNYTLFRKKSNSLFYPTSGRFAILYEEPYTSLTSNSKFVKHTLAILAGRTVWEYVNLPHFLGLHFMWTFRRNVFFIEDFKMLIASYTESGLQRKFRRAIDWKFQIIAMNLSLRSSYPWVRDLRKNLSSYTVTTEKNEAILSVDERTPLISFTKLWIVILVYFYLLTLATVVYVIEVGTAKGRLLLDDLMVF